MRLFLDAHVSGRRIAVPLRAAGHDVRAADEERLLEGLGDRDLLTLASSEGRILITFNARDFAPITREWAEAAKSHSGCAILVGIDHGEFGVILRALQMVLTARPRQVDWEDYTVFVPRHP